PVGIYAQGAGGSALAAALSAAHAGAQLIACAIYPLALTLHRVSGEALTEALSGAGLSPGIDIDRLWEATDLVDEHIGDELVTPLVPRIAVLAARHDVPASVVAGIDHSLQAENAADRLAEVRERSGDIAASEEELLLLGLFGEDAERLLRGIRSRGRRDSESRIDENRAQRVQEIVRIVQESGIGEVTIEEDGMRISVRSTPDLPAVTPGEASLAVPA